MTGFPRVGETFAGYRLDGLLGRGGMSTVFRAENVRLGNIVALKVLSAELADDDQFRERFVRESRVASSMHHPNIIPITDAGQEDEHLFIVMRFVNGSDLKAVIHRHGRLEPAGCLEIVSQVASALDAAHAKNLLHRDVKPANILLESSGVDYRGDHVYLSDFGLIKHASSTSGLTKTGHFVGTIDYMAPEQIELGSVDHRADIYALGCVTFECLTGTVPFVRDTDAAVLWAHIRDELPKATPLCPGLPAQVDDVIAQALAKSPEDRYQGARELVIALSEALASGPSPRMHESAAQVAYAATVTSESTTPTPEQASPLIVDDAPMPESADPVTSRKTAIEPEPQPTTGAPPPVMAAATGAAASKEEPPPPGAGGRRRRASLPGWLLAAIVAVGAAVVTGVTVYLTTGNEPATTATTGSLPTGAAETVVGPDTSIEDLVEPALYRGCVVDSPPRLGASASATCERPGDLAAGQFYPDRLDLFVFENGGSLAAAYDEARQNLGIGRNFGQCSGRQWGGESAWIHGTGKPGGRHFCTFEGNVSVIAWTHDKLGQDTHKDFLGIARLGGSDHARIFNWWNFWHHRNLGKLPS